MNLDFPSYIWFYVAIALTCTLVIAVEIAILGRILARIDRRGRDIEHKLHLLQYSIDYVAGSVDSMEENTRPSGNLP